MHAFADAETLSELDPLIGQSVHGVRIESLIGEGSAARVYRGTHRVLGRPCAVKVLSLRSGERSEQVERLLREAEALGRIEHKNVVTVIDAGQLGDGRPFIIMELLRGQTLGQAVACGPFGAKRFAALAKQMAAGLAAAHRLGLVHRDLKPSNVMLVDRDGREEVKLLDFGLVRRFGADRAARDNLTIEEALIGTPRYMAPEQVLCAKDVGPAADIYALGVMFYEMLSGKPPFDGETLTLLQAQLTAIPRPLPTRTGYESLVAAMLQKKPADRPPTADAVLEALELLAEEAMPTIHAVVPTVDLGEERTVTDTVFADPTHVTLENMPVARPSTDNTRIVTEDDLALRTPPMRVNPIARRAPAIEKQLAMRPQLKTAWSSPQVRVLVPVTPSTPPPAPVMIETKHLRRAPMGFWAVIAAMLVLSLALAAHLRTSDAAAIVVPAIHAE